MENTPERTPTPDENDNSPNRTPEQAAAPTVADALLEQITSREGIKECVDQQAANRKKYSDGELTQEEYDELNQTLKNDMQVYDMRITSAGKAIREFEKDQYPSPARKLARGALRVFKNK